MQLYNLKYLIDNNLLTHKNRLKQTKNDGNYFKNKIH